MLRLTYEMIYINASLLFLTWGIDHSPIYTVVICVIMTPVLRITYSRTGSILFQKTVPKNSRERYQIM